jgi:hypothetical protein
MFNHNRAAGGGFGSRVIRASVIDTDYVRKDLHSLANNFTYYLALIVKRHHQPGSMSNGFWNGALLKVEDGLRPVYASGGGC